MAEENNENTDSPISRGFMVSAGIVGLVAIMGVAVVGVILWPDQEEEAPSTPEAAATADPAPESETAAPQNRSKCDLPDVDETMLPEAPETEWGFVGTMQAPSNEEAGPGIVSDTGLRHCYAHSPVGALMAASNIMAMGTDPDLVQEVNEEMVAEGPGQEAALADLERNGTYEDTPLRTTIVGFQVLGFGPNSSRVDIAVEASNGMFASVTTDLRWEEGDWKVALRDNGQPHIPVAQLQDASGYIPWSADAAD